MKVIGLQIENLRKIKAMILEFKDKGLIEIRGKNEQGKSTILDALEILLRGKKFTPKDVITHGEKKSRIISEIGEYRLERVITEKDQKIKITGKDGRLVTSSPQAFLEKLINELTFDPRPFLDKTSDQKLKFMMALLDLDFTEIDRKLADKETERTFVGREVKAFGDLPILAKVESVDVTELMAEKEKADNHNAKIQRGIEKKKSLNDSIDQIDSDIKKLEIQIQELNDRKDPLKKELTVVIDALESLPNSIDTEDLKNKIENASETNRKALEYETNQKKKADKVEKETLYEDLSNDIKSLRAEKEMTLKNAKMPVKGLEIRENGVFYDGIHCDNWSDSQSMKVSFELCVAMNPELKAVFIDRGESYDKEQLAILNDWALKNDIQAFITIVDSGAVGDVENAIYIEDGSVVNS